MAKPFQYNIGDRVVITGTIVETPCDGTTVNNESKYSVRVDGNSDKFDYVFNFSALGHSEEKKSQEQEVLKTIEALPYHHFEPPVQFPFTQNISEIQIKYK